MSAPKAPAPPDPKETAASQTASNIGTAIANQRLNNMNQITPDGTLRYEETGNYQYTDPLNGAVYDIPLMTAIQELSPEQQAIQDQNRRADLNMSRFAADQSEKANQLLSNPFDISSIQAGGDPNSIGNVNLQKVGSGMPTLQSNIPDAGQIQTGIGNSGDITKTYGIDFSKDRQRVEDALLSRIQPQLDSRRKAMEINLANKGITAGSEQYESAMEDLMKGENDAYYGAILNAGQEQSRLADLEARRAGFQNAAQAQQYAQNMGSSNFTNQAQNQQFNQNMQKTLFGNQVAQQGFDNRLRGIASDNQTEVTQQNADLAKFNALNTARNQALNEAFAVRNQPINEITSLLSGTNVQNPNFVSPNVANIANTDYAGIQSDYDKQMFQRAKAKSDFQTNLFGSFADAGASIGSAAIMASDIRVKENIDKVGHLDNGLGVYTYNYIGEDRISVGVMAQEVDNIMPHAVIEMNGIKHVNYNEVLQ